MGDTGSMERRDPDVEIQRTLGIFAPNGQVIELRALGTGSGVASGYYNDPAKLAREAISWNGKASGVYFTLNRVKPELLSRAANRMRRYSKHATSDADIIYRDWLLVDFDPVRPSGISATDLEYEAALARARKCSKWLLQHKFPSDALVLADSGNGSHVLLRIDLPNDPESHALIKTVLSVIDLQFSDEHVKVDVTTGNASRLCKLYGTLAAKGDSTPERPHRISRLIDTPSVISPVPRHVLQGLASLSPRPESDEHHAAYGDFNLENWVKKHGLEVSKSAPWSGTGRKYILARCPWNPEHTDQAAYIVQLPNGAIAAGCHHNGCSGKNWHDLRAMVDPGWQRARERRETPTYGSGPDGIIPSGRRMGSFVYPSRTSAPRSLVISFWTMAYWRNAISRSRPSSKIRSRIASRSRLRSLRP